MRTDDNDLDRPIDLVPTGREDTKQAFFSIGDLAREFGVTLRTLRFYEDKGLLTPERDGLNRIYSRRDRARLKLVLMGKKVGFSLVEIKDMLDLYDLKDGRDTQLKVARERFQAQIDVLQKQKREVESAIDELARAVSVVDGLLAEQQARRG